MSETSSLTYAAQSRFIADERIEVIPAQELVFVDGTVNNRIAGVKFDILSLLAARVDGFVSRPEISDYLWQEATASTDANVRAQVYKLRKELGEELGDAKTGAIRTKANLGYRALSSLTHNVATSNTEYAPVHLIADGRISVDTVGQSARKDGELLEDLTEMEFKLLAELAKQPDKVITRDDLLAAVWGHVDEYTYRSARVILKNLRDKLGSELGDPKTGVIRSKFGKGYYALSSLYPQVIDIL